MGKKTALVVCLAFIALALKGQPFTLDKDFKAQKLLLHKFNNPSEPKAKGRLSITTVTQTEDTLFFFVKDASIYSPVHFALQTKGTVNNGPLQITLHKMSWRKAERKGTTDANGYWSEGFKTENDFGIRVIANSKPAIYRMMVWVGDEIKIDIPSAFKKADASKSSGHFLKNNLVYIILVSLVVLVITLLLKLKKTRNAQKI
jgi:hypothetical protein